MVRDSITDSIDMSLSKLWKRVEDRGARCAAVHGVIESPTWLRDWTTTAVYPSVYLPVIYLISSISHSSVYLSIYLSVCLINLPLVLFLWRALTNKSLYLFSPTLCQHFPSQWIFAGTPPKILAGPQMYKCQHILSGSCMWEARGGGKGWAAMRWHPGWLVQLTQEHVRPVGPGWPA